MTFFKLFNILNIGKYQNLLINNSKKIILNFIIYLILINKNKPLRGSNKFLKVALVRSMFYFQFVYLVLEVLILSIKKRKFLVNLLKNN